MIQPCMNIKLRMVFLLILYIKKKKEQVEQTLYILYIIKNVFEILCCDLLYNTMKCNTHANNHFYKALSEHTEGKVEVKYRFD